MYPKTAQPSYPVTVEISNGEGLGSREIGTFGRERFLSCMSDLRSDPEALNGVTVTDFVGRPVTTGLGWEDAQALL